ncbi:FAD-dependent monooxygenase [Nonomuraea sp. NPDC050328]|uniref:FAD-dependent monooxygenase n=1 Tax=Nonomuraea sp. NPDC050328 TaxID=3364361 RepID=UPI0037B0AB60
MDILISGASIAGTTTAYWLRRYGHTVTVVERAPAIRPGGYKVDIRGAALDVIRRMGLLDQVRAHSTDMRHATHYNRAGKPVAVMDAAIFGGREGEDEEIMRGDLNRLLFDLTRDEVEYVFDDTITAIADDGTVTFENSAPRVFDVVVGADGVHSTTRRLAFGDESRFAREMGHYVAICSVPNHLGLDREEACHVAPGRTAMVYSTRAATDAKALFLWSSPALDHDRHDVAAQKRLLAEAMSGLGWEVPALLEHVERAEDFYFDSLTRIHLDTWSAGRVVLVGDAAYCASPASGQGTSLALVGAYVLAGELARGDGFAGYEREMRAFAEANQKLADTNLKGMVMSSAVAIWISMKVLSLVPRLPMRDAMVERIAGPIREAANGIELKSYL